MRIVNRIFLSVALLPLLGFGRCSQDPKGFFGIKEKPAPTLVSIDPTEGPVAGGTVITFTGKEFSESDKIMLGEGECYRMEFISSTEITCVTPEGDAGKVDVMVKDKLERTSILSGGWTYIDEEPPILISILPASGSASGGSLLSLNGEHFTSSDKVLIGGASCSNFHLVSETQIKCNVPPGPIGQADVSVVNLKGKKSVLANAWTYTSLNNPPIITNVSPNVGPLAGLNVVTVDGTDFLPGVMVQIGNNTCPLLGFAATQLTCQAPANVAGTYNVTVINPDLQMSILPLSYTYLPAPTITTVAPVSGPMLGGTAITITGTHFAFGVTVTVGGNACGSPATGPTTVICNTPAGPAGPADVVVTNPDGQFATAVGAFTYYPPPTLTNVAPSGGPLSGGTLITLTGTNFRIGATITVGTFPCNSVGFVSATTLTCSTPTNSAGVKNVTITNDDNQSATLNNSFTYQPAPIPTNLTPTHGALAGGTTITIDGTGFINGATATVGGTTCTSPNVLSATQMTCATPPHVAGTYTFVITNPDFQTGTLSNSYTYQPAPTLSAVNPPAGPLAGGTVITLTGTGFLAGATVTVDGFACTTPSVTNATTMTCSTPARPAGSKTIVVTNFDMQTGSLLNAYTYQPAPTVASILPTAGALAGGTPVNIIGTGFLALATVSLGGSACTSVNVVSSTSINCTTGAHAAGVTNLTVTNTDGQFDTLIGAYSYQPAPTLSTVAPNAGPLGGGTTITLTGTNFLPNATVDVGAAACTSITVVNGTQITCVTPANAAGPYPVKITNTDTQSATLNNAYTYYPPPTFSAILPNFGIPAGGTNVTITGTGFLNGATILFDGLPCTSVVVAATQIDCTTPPGFLGNADILITNTDGQSVLAPAAFSYQNLAPTITTVSPTGGPIGGGMTIVLTGTNYLAGALVTIGGTTCTSPFVASTTQITCVTPAKAVGSYDVVITNTDLQQGTLTNGYTYQLAPTVTLVTPNSGRTGSLTAVTITGTGFLSGALATIGGSACNSLTVVSPTSITCTTGGGAAGPADVVVINFDNQSGNLVGGFNYIPPPQVNSVAPVGGPLGGGTSLVLLGSAFINGATISVGGNNCPATFISATQLNCTAPAHAAGLVDVIVTNPDGQVSNLASSYNYNSGPSLSSIAPVGGPLVGGTPVTLTGTGFLAGASVTFGGTACTTIVVVSATSITCNTPAKSAGPYNVVVTNLDGQLSTLIGGYTYLPAPIVTVVTPNSGALAGGTALTIDGSNFVVGATVAINGSSCSITMTTPTQILCTTGVGAAGTYAVVVTNPDTQQGSLAASYTYRAAPTVTSVSPLGGLPAGGTNVTITGTGYYTGSTVTFAGTLCTSIIVVSATSITCTTPAHAAGAVTVVVTNADTQTGFKNNAYTYQPGPNLVSISPNANPLAGGTQITLTGTNFFAGATVDIGSVACGSVNVASATSITCTPAAQVEATYNVKVTNTDTQFSTLVGSFFHRPAPTLASIAPIGGALAGNTSVTLTGTGFVAGATVTIGGTNCTSVVVSSATTITCNTPAKAAAAYDVIIANVEGQSATLLGAYTYRPAPTLVSIAPIAGALAGGTAVTITGTDFTTPATVTIGGNACGTLTVVNPTTITCTTAAHATGATDVRVTNVDNQLSNILVGGYTYQPAPTLSSAWSPSQGPLAGGTTVTMTGTNFLPGATILLGGTVCTSPTYISATSYTCVTPAKTAGLYAGTFTNFDNQSIVRGNVFRYNPAPTVTAVTPSSGFLFGGYTVTLTGTGFLAGITVTVNGVACGSVVLVNATTVTCTVASTTTPATVDVAVLNLDGQPGGKLGGFTYNTDGFKFSTLLAGPLSNSNTNATGSSARMSESAYAIAYDGTANLYVADAGYCVIRKINVGTTAVTTLSGTAGNCVAAASIADGSAATASFAAPYSMAYVGGTLYVGDAYTIRTVNTTTGAVATIAGAAGQNGTTNNTGTSARFGASIYGLAGDATNLYISDSSNHMIRQMALSGLAVTTLAGSAGSPGFTNATGTSAQFHTPGGLATDGTTVFVGDTLNHVIRQIDIGTGAVLTLAGSGIQGTVDASGLGADFDGPLGLHLSGADLYVVDFGGQVVRKIVISGAAVTTITGQNQATRNDIGAAAYLWSPMGVTGDGTNLYVTDKALATVRKIVMSSLSVSSIVGKIDQFGVTNGAGASALFQEAYQPTVIGTTMYLPDRGNCQIRTMNISTAVVAILAGNVLGFCSNNPALSTGTGTNAYFFNPQATTGTASFLYVADGRTIRKIDLSTGFVSILTGQVATPGASDGSTATALFGGDTYGIVSDGTYLYVSDYANSAIRRVDISTGDVTTPYGALGVPGTTNAVGTASRFSSPKGLAFSTDLSKLYVADSGNCSIREITISSGNVVTFAGLSGTCGLTDATSSSARFNAPSALTTDGTNLFVYDSASNSIRKVDLAGAVVTTLFDGRVGTVPYLSDTSGTFGTTATIQSLRGMVWSTTGLYVTNDWNIRRLY